VLPLCVQHAGAAVYTDFDVYECPLGGGEVEYHCRGKVGRTASGLVRGVTAGGMGFFEGDFNSSVNKAYVSWWNVSLAVSNPDRMAYSQKYSL